MRQCHAIILGGGCAGLLAAQVLREYFTTVSVVERYQNAEKNKSDNYAVSQRIPQAAHIHVLLKRGQNIFDEIFPGILDELKKQCPSLDWAMDSEWHGPFGNYPQYASGVETLFFSRFLLDCMMRERIQQHKNVTLINGTAQIIFDKERQAAVGATILDEKFSYRLFGDLVVDARGRRSNILRSLSLAGFNTDAPECVSSALSYSSCIYEHQVAREGLKQFYWQVRPGKRHYGAVISPIEHRRVFVTLITLKEAPPKTREDFAHVLNKILDKSALSFLKDAKPLGPISVFRNFANLRNSFGKMKSWPQGLIAVGDATCLLNPVYGQGMTVAAEQMMLLKQYGASGFKSQTRKRCFEQEYQRFVDRITLFPWLMATIEDKRAENKSALSLRTVMLQHYIDRILRGSLRNQKLHYAFLRTLHLLDSPQILFRPEIFIRALLGGSW